MSKAELNALYFSFAAVFNQLVRRGLIEGDQETLDEFWVAFLNDMARFPNDWTRQLVS
jgi:hypothetical protein